MKESGRHGKRVFSELDAIVDIWLHTIYNDPTVPGSEYLPVLYYRNMKDRPLLSYAYLAERWGWSKAKVGRFIPRLEEDGIVSHISFSSTHGSVISVTGYREMIHGTETESSRAPELSEILGAVTIATGEIDAQNLCIHVRKCVPCRKLIGKSRYLLEIQALEGRRGPYSVCRFSLIYHNCPDSRSPTVEAGTYENPVPEQLDRKKEEV